MPRVYSGSAKAFYRVTELSDNSLLVEVLHSNKQWRDRLLGLNPRVMSLPHDVIAPKDNNIRAAAVLFDVIQDFPAAFRAGRVEFAPGLSETPTVTPPTTRDDAAPTKDFIRTQAQSQCIQSNGARTYPFDSELRVARSFLYRQLYRLPQSSPASLPDLPGLYAIFERGELLGIPVDNVPGDALRCVKVGMAEKQSVRSRIKDQYLGTSHRAASPRKYVGDALIGEAMTLRDLIECNAL